jgi:hypothetical protein
MTFPLGLPKNLLIGARPSTGLGLVLDCMVRDLIVPTGHVLFVCDNGHEATQRVEQFRRAERVAQQNSTYTRCASSIALNECRNADAFLSTVDDRMGKASWATPAVIVRDASGDLPLGAFDTWLQFLPHAIETYRAHFVTATSSGGSGRDLPNAAMFDDVWTLTEWQHPDQRTPKFDSEVQLNAGNRSLVFAAKDRNGVRVYRISDQPVVKELNHVA